MQEVKIALLGAGTVGAQVARLLTVHQDELNVRAGAKLTLIGVAVRNINSQRDWDIPSELLTTDAYSIIRQADVVIELMGGIHPAREYILEAFKNGASVVTGNKALLAEYGPELHDAADEAQVDLYYEAAVGGAVPVVYGLRESLSGDRITHVLGIVNGTTNYILDKMTTKGLSYEVALKKAQELGFAEADPTADVDGFDAAAKCALLASLAFHTRVSLSDVPTEGIRGITPGIIASAKANNYTVKLVASAKRREDGIELFVGPALIPNAHPLANIRGVYNAIVVEGEAADRLMFYGPGAGGAPTASAVLSDLVAAANHKANGGFAPRELVYGDTPILDGSKATSRYQLKMVVQDSVGVLHAIMGVFAKNNVSISDVSQENENDGKENTCYLTVTTHEAVYADLQNTIDELNNASQAVTRFTSILRVENA
ncbi:homoserine dehydrogenase [Actinotignum urinale]|uniref:Homoserine dehydrogenase n=1 Tax=Actinotignum urinale TaxID=190146 RepID=A0ABU5G6C5_9ACTO|nr:homoserine dehydrogenase [Actinotignum urinale]MDY5132900.1 homoserine dehydrogenase [Actinotignum urinale]